MPISPGTENQSFLIGHSSTNTKKSLIGGFCLAILLRVVITPSQDRRHNHQEMFGHAY